MLDNVQYSGFLLRSQAGFRGIMCLNKCLSSPRYWHGSTIRPLDPASIHIQLLRYDEHSLFHVSIFQGGT